MKRRAAKKTRAKTRIVPPILFSLGIACLGVVPECGNDSSQSQRDLSPPEDFRGFPIDVCGVCGFREDLRAPLDLESPDLELPDGSED